MKPFVEPLSYVAEIKVPAAICVTSPGASINGYTEDEGAENYFG